MSSSREQVVRIVAEVLERPVAQLSLEDRFLEELGASSLDIVTLVIRIEQHFGLAETPEDELEQIHSIGDLVAMVEALRVGPSEAPQPDGGERVDVVIASDHAGVGLKAELVAWLVKQQVSVRDLGPSDTLQVDYPDFASRVGFAVRDGAARFGVLICGSGVGMSIAANKVSGARAALVSEPVSAALCRQHNDANILCLGARMIGPTMAQRCVEAFLSTPFDPGDDGRHKRRVEQMARLERDEPVT